MARLRTGYRAQHAAPRRSLAWSVLGVLLAATVPALTGTGTAQAAVCAAEMFDATEARRVADECGIRVEITGSRTETSQVFAEPGGGTTLDATAMPVRVRRPDGNWVPINTTLVRQPDGSVVPGAITAAVRFSGGGSAPLVTLERGTPWTLSWPSALPVPTLAGDTATYAEVLPGVDLVVRATVDGFSHLLVVKTPAAAANPQVQQIRYRMAGGTVTTGADRQVTITAPDGTPLASASGADMWDSTPGSGGEGEFDSSVAGPGTEARQEDMGVSVSGADLVIAPDKPMLSDPAVVYPLYLDPAFTVGRTRWAYANNNNVNNSDGKAWVGKDPVNLNRYRSFFEFNVSALRGRHILSASLEATLYHSWSCASTPVYLYRTTGITSTPRATWSSMTLSRYLDTRSAHAHKGSSSCGNQPDVVMWFNGNLTADVQSGANANWTTYTVGFCACSSASGSGETVTERWKKFHASTVKLHATYNSYPATPASLTTTPTSPCATGTGRPAINTWTPQLKATLTDPDAGASLRADFAYSVNGGASWTAMPRTGGQASGLSHVVTMPNLSGSAPASLAWRVRAWDGTDFSKVWSATCEFTVDTDPPADPVLQPGAALPPYPGGPPATVVVGSPVAVPVTSGGSSDVVGYWYAVGTSQISPPRQTYVAANTDGSATLNVVPVVSGLSANWLTVQSVDRAGNFSPEATYTFRANPAS